MLHWFFEIVNPGWVWWIVNVLYSLTIVAIIIVVVSENRNPVKSLAWVTVLLVVPLVGIVFYFVFGRNIQTKRMISRRNRRRLNRVAAPHRINLKRANVSQGRKRQMLLAQSVCGSGLYEGNEIDIFHNGADKFEALISDINSAQSTVYLQYYIISDDNVGSRVLDALEQAARRGVKVRVIYDHVGSFSLSRRRLKSLQRAGVEAHPFFKVVFPPFGTRINWRNHRKIAIIDGQTAYIGGMNIADRYVDGGKKFKLWRDLHLRLRGPGVVAVLESFAVDWNFMGNPMLEEFTKVSEESKHLLKAEPTSVGATVQLITSGPTHTWLNMTFMLQQAISLAKKSVYVQTPYFIPSEGLLQALQIAALAKVDVRVMLPWRSDSDMLRWASNSYISQCLRSGIKVYFFKEGMLHSKAVIIDDDFATVGSTNFDFRSFEHNFEANLMVYSREFNERMKRRFYDDLAQSERVRPQEWASRPWYEKVLESVMRLFSPIL